MSVHSYLNVCLLCLSLCLCVRLFSISTPLSMDMFAWTRRQAVLYNGVILACIGFESIFVFIAVKVISQK